MYLTKNVLGLIVRRIFRPVSRYLVTLYSLFASEHASVYQQVHTYVHCIHGPQVAVVPVEPAAPPRNHHRPAPRDTILTPDWVGYGHDSHRLSLPIVFLCASFARSSALRTHSRCSCNRDMPRENIVQRHALSRSVVVDRTRFFCSTPNAANMLKSLHAP